MPGGSSLQHDTLGFSQAIQSVSLPSNFDYFDNPNGTGYPTTIRPNPDDDDKFQTEAEVSSPEVILTGGIGKNVFDGIDGLLESEFSNSAIKFEPIRALAVLSNSNVGAEELYYDSTKGRWNFCLESKQILSGCFDGMRRKIYETGLVETGGDYEARRWVDVLSECDSDVYGGTDNLILYHHFKSSTSQFVCESRQIGITFIYRGPTFNNCGVSSALKASTEFVKRVLAEQPDRKHVMTAMLLHSKMCMVLFNRAGVFVSEFFDIHDQPESFVRFVVGSVFMDYDNHGFDQSLRYSRLDDNGRMSVTVNGSRFTINSVLYIEKCIRGRGTVCCEVWSVSAGEAYVTKDTHRRAHEVYGESNTMFALQGVPYVVQIMDSENKGDSTSNLRHLYAMKESMRSLRVDHFLCELHASGEERILTRIVMYPAARQLSTFRCQKELLTVFTDAVSGKFSTQTQRIYPTEFSYLRLLGLEGMYNRGYLHCDISYGNITITREGRGLLIDLESAITIGSPAPEMATIAFCSTRRLIAFGRNNDYIPTYVDDLESLFHVIIYTCCRHTGMGGVFGTNWVSFQEQAWACLEKQNTMLLGQHRESVTNCDEELFKVNVLGKFDNDFESMKTCVRNLRQVLFTTDVNTSVQRELDGVMTAIRNNKDPWEVYKLIRRCLVEARDTLPLRYTQGWVGETEMGDSSPNMEGLGELISGHHDNDNTHVAVDRNSTAVDPNPSHQERPQPLGCRTQNVPGHESITKRHMRLSVNSSSEEENVRPPQK